ncbi:DegT/DnrJ/EryC1/StrS family aminotransferase [Chloroflexota bacterium]
MRNIPLFEIYWDEQDIEKVTSVIKKGMYWAIGPEIREFEKKVAEYVGVRYAFAVNSGTSALHATLAAHGIGEGDEVIVPSFTFIATANCALFVGAKPVFAEIEEETYGLDPEDVEKKITPQTKAIIPVHVVGLPCHIKELKQIAQKHNLILIEDTAESLGAMVDGKKVGSFGDSAILSFCASKVITTGEGGMILTNSRDLYERIKLICNQGRAETADYFTSTEQMQYVTLGYNFRMSTMAAALGLAQMEKIDEIIRRRRDNANYLTQRLSEIEGITSPKVPEGYFHVHQMYTIRLKGGEKTRKRWIEHLARHGITSKLLFQPVHLTQFYRQNFGFREGDLPLTEKVASEVLILPVYPTLIQEKMSYIIQQIEDFFARGAE